MILQKKQIQEPQARALGEPPPGGEKGDPFSLILGRRH